jgi:hypothetical protein
LTSPLYKYGSSPSTPTSIRGADNEARSPSTRMDQLLNQSEPESKVSDSISSTPALPDFYNKSIRNTEIDNSNTVSEIEDTNTSISDSEQIVQQPSTQNKRRRRTRL